MANLKSADILAELKMANKLPIIPDTLKEFEAAWSNPGVHLNDLVVIVEKNAEITQRIINSANSPIYKASENVTEIGAAVGRLGMTETRSIVHAVSLHKTFQAHHIEPRQFWRHSILTAYCARHIAAYMKSKLKWDVNPNLAFLAGLLHEVGIIMMWRYFERRYDEVRDQSRGFDQFVDNEHGMLHMTHSVLGAAILHEWHFPAEIIMAIAGHHHPERLTGDHYKMAYVVCLAEASAWLTGEGNGFYPANVGQTSQHLLTHLAREGVHKDQLMPIALKAREDANASGMLTMF